MKNKITYRIFINGLVIMALVTCTPVITSKLEDSAVMDSSYRYQITADRDPTEFDATVPPPNGLSTNSATGEISGTVLEMGQFDIPISASNSYGTDEKTLNLKVSAPSHPVVREKELFIIDPSVVQSAPQAQPGGSWHIRSVMQRLAGEKQDVDTFAEAWFDEWGSNQTVNGDLATARPRTSNALKAAWQNDRFRLIAVVNRIDLTRFEGNDPDGKVVNLGEGRFIYEVLNPSGPGVQNFTIIFEFGLPRWDGTATLKEDLDLWAQNWHLLGRPSLGDSSTFNDQYLTELERLTSLFSAHGQINQVRTNDFIQSPWQLREFTMQDSQLKQSDVAQTPRDPLNNQTELSNFINSNEEELLNGTHLMPASLRGAKSDQPHTWSAPGTNAQALFTMSFNTCNGCHTLDTGTGFQMIEDSRPGQAARLTRFLTNEITLAHPLPGQGDSRWDEMTEREKLLARFAKDERVRTSSAEQRAALEARSGRVH